MDLVIEQGLSARKTGFIVGIVERIAQHYVKQYKDDNEKRLPGQKKSRVLHQRSLSRVIQTFFAVTLTRSLKQYFGKQGMHCLKSFPSIQSLNLSSLHRHLLRHASLTLKKLEPGVAARTAQRTLELRREGVLKWLGHSNMNQTQSCISINETGFDMHIHKESQSF